MKFFIEKNKDIGHRVTINIPKKTVDDAIVKELVNISKKTNINGFRKGKIPIKIVQKKYGDTIYYDVFKTLMQKFFNEFINKEKIKIIGSPKYYMHKNEDKKKEFFEYSVIYDMYPKFQIKDIQDIKVKKIIINITNEDIKNSIEKYNIKKNIWNIENKRIKYYDRVTINYCIYIKNKKIEKFNKENVRFIVAENTYISELDKTVINHYLNDIIFFKIKFHSFYPEKELQNQDITFKIKIIKIEKKQVPEIEEVNKKDSQEEKLTDIHYENIKNNINNQIKQITQKHLEEQIIQKIVKKNIILIPKNLLQEEINFLYKKHKKQYKENNHHLLEKKYHINIELEAKKRLCMQILTQKIISENELFIDENNIQLLIKKISLHYKKPTEIIKLYNKNQDLKNTIKNMELEKKAMLLLQKNIQIIKQYWTFYQFINYNWKNYEELIT